MKQFIERQEKLHLKAMKLLKDIRECQSFFSFDPEYMAEKIKGYREEYAEVIQSMVAPVIETMEEQMVA